MIDRRNLLGSGLALAAATGFPRRAFADADPPVTNPILVDKGRVWISATLNGKGPYPFIVDTGAVLSIIDIDFAKKAGLSATTGRPIAGVGGKVAYHSWYIAREVRLTSGIRFQNTLFAGIAKRLSAEAVGTFGAGLFTTYDSDFDFAKGEWRAWIDGRPNFDGLTRLPSRFLRERGGQRLVVEASIDDFAGDFLIDTGAPGLSLTGRAADKSGLWDSDKPYAPTRAQGIGDGDGIPARIYRAGRLKMGRFVFENSLVKLNEPGTRSVGWQDGIIGLSTLSLLNLSTDVSEGALYATPNGRAEPKLGYPLSGLWIDEAKGHVVVSDVGIGSPATQAGVRKGDVLRGGDLQAMIRAITGGPGKEVSLKIERDGAPQDVRYTLKPWF